MVLIGATAASATPSPLPGAPNQHLTLAPKAPKGATIPNSSLADLSYSGEAAPAPQYSSSNHTIHWGLKLICNQVAYITVRDDLLEVVGNGDNEHYDYIDTVSRVATATNVAATTSHSCNGSVNTRWIARGYATVDGIRVPPYPTWSALHTLPCGAW